MNGLARALALLLAASAAGLGFASAAVRTWSASPEEMARGEADGVAISVRGALFPAPRVERLGEGPIPGEPSHVWAVAADAGGNLYLGTGPDGRVVKVTPSGAATIHFTVGEPMITALAIAPGGELLAASAPGGIIYRIGADGTGRVFCETGERYVWSLLARENGVVFAGTGERGRLLRIDRGGNVSTFFDGDEAHLVSIAALPDGSLVAGGAGRGLVYEIDGEGNGAVLYEDTLAEAVAVAVDRSGGVIAAFVAEPEARDRPPELRLRLPDGVRVGAADEEVGRLDEPGGPQLQGVIEGLAPPPGEPVPRLRGRVVRIQRSGESSEIWSSTSETPFTVLVDGSGSVHFGAGEPARIYRVDATGDVARIASLREAQVTGLAASAGAVLAATSNPAAAYRIDSDRSEGGLFVSRPIDAGGPARWGAVAWNGARAIGGRIEIDTRSGNSRDPDGTWSAWSAVPRERGPSRADNPDARYLQWRARFLGPAGDGNRLTALSIRYETLNRAPRGVELRQVEGPSEAGRVALRWSGADPDGDPLDIELELRREGATAWERALERPVSAAESPGGGPLAWETAGVAEGRYEVRAVLSDERAHAPGEGRRAVSEPPLSIVVDRTAPTIELDGGSLAIVRDEGSGVARLELVEGDRVRFTLRPRDGLCDSEREEFELLLPAAEGRRKLRAVDGAGNRSEVGIGEP